MSFMSSFCELLARLPQTFGAFVSRIWLDGNREREVDCRFASPSPNGLVDVEMLVSISFPFASNHGLSGPRAASLCRALIIGLSSRGCLDIGCHGGSTAGSSLISMSNIRSVIDRLVFMWGLCSSEAWPCEAFCAVACRRGAFLGRSSSPAKAAWDGSDLANTV